MANGRTLTLDKVRRGILAGTWNPGQRLQPGELAKEFGTSTTVVRESLSLLAGDGLVVARANHGFFVPDLDLQELRNVTELRCQVESFAAQLSVQNATVEWEAALTAAHHRLSRTTRRSAEHPDRITPEWMEAHRSFHQALLEACGSPVITHLAENLADSTELYRRWSAPAPAAYERDVEAEHRQLLEAALAHDARTLASLLRKHYEATVDVVLRAGLKEEALTRA